MATQPKDKPKQYEMVQRRLANADLKAIRPPAPPLKGLEIRDTACDGLRLRVSPTGKMTWSVVYRVTGAAVTETGLPKKGPPTRFTLGTTEVKYNDARKRALEIMELASQGVDYAEQHKAKALGRSARSVEALIDRFIDEYARPVTAKSGNREELARNWLRKPELEKWKGRELSDITRADIHAVLDKVVAGRGEPAAIEMRKHMSKFFHWAVDRQIITTNPISRLDRVEAYTERERVLSMDELRRVWDAAGDMGNPFGPFYRMLILTGARRAEIAEMERDWRKEIKLDKDDEEAVPVVVVPPSKHKSRRGQTFYLSPPAVAILDSLPVFKDKFLFSSTGGKSAVSGFDKAHKRLIRILNEKSEEAELEPIEHFTRHDIRRTVATNLADMGIPGDTIQRVLGQSMGKLKRTYIKHDYAAEMRDAMLRWGALWA